MACLQFALAVLGYYAGEMTANFDQPTSAALAQFQGDVGLRPDGLGDRRTLVMLGIWSGRADPDPLGCVASGDIKPKESGDGVRCLQRALHRLGYFNDEPDGVNGDRTVTAITRYQKASGLTADGVAGAVTLAALDIWSGKVSTDPAKYVPSAPARPAYPLAADGPWPAPQLDWPEWNLSPEGIPYFGNHRICTRENANIIAAEFAKDGADIDTQQFFVYIASRETGCRYDGVNVNPRTQDDSHCAFQINVLAGVFEPTAVLGRKGWTPENIKVSMNACADAASDFWVYCGRGPWIKPYYCRPPWQN